MSEPNGQPDIWQLLQEASYHLQNPPPGGWEHPEDVEKVRQLLQKDPSHVHAFDGEGTPLHKAASWCLPAIAEVLLEFGADVHAQPEGAWTPLHQAIQKCQNEDADIRLIEILLRYGADPNIRSSSGESPMDMAYGRAAEVLQQRGGKLDLNKACRLGRVEEVKQMLASDRDAVMHAREPRRLLSDALWTAATNETATLEIISLLLQHGAGVNAADSDQGTALYYACGGAAPISVSRLLLLHGADVNAAYGDGTTPLDMARKCRRDDVVELLIQAGAR
jgi:ankyrin repeat protein